MIPRRLVALACVCGMAVATPAGQIFRSGVDAVAVDVLVTRRGQPVTGLTADDFEVLDNDVPQRIDSITLEEVPMTLLLVLDTSGAPPTLPLVTFSDKLRTVVAPPAPVSMLPDALGRLRAGGATALYDATFAALTLREQTVGRHLMLIFSDGDDTASWLDPREVLTMAQRSDVVVYGVTLDEVRRESSVDRQSRASARRWFPTEPFLFRRQFLPRLVEDTGGSQFVAEDVGRLRDAFERVVGEFRSRYLLTYAPTGVESAGWHALEVRVRGRGRRVQARRGYLR